MSKLRAVAYYAGIPARNNNPEKPMILDNFLQGVKAVGDEAIAHHGTNLIDADVALIQGFVHELGKTAPHLQLRRNILDHQHAQMNRSLIVDSNLFLYADPGNTKRYLRYSYDGVFPCTGFYFDAQIDPARWQKISKDLNISLKPYTKTGNYILVCCQRNGGWSMKGLPVPIWLDQTIKKIKQYTNRPIVVRPHPGDKKWHTYLNVKPYDNVTLSTNNLKDDLKNAWATVVFNSSPSVASLIEGVPTFVTDQQPEFSQVLGVCNTNLENIETPEYHDRQSWIERISMSHWNFDELKSGHAWKFFRQYMIINKKP